MKNSLIFFLMSATLALSACHMLDKPALPPKEVPAAGNLHSANEDQLSQVSSFISAGRYANESNPDGPAKSTVQGSLDTALSFLKPPQQKHLDFAMGLAMTALKGDLDKAQTGWDKSKTDGVAAQQRIKELEKQVSDQQAQAALDIQNALSKAQRDADNKQRAIITYILFGSSVLCIIAAVVVANFASVVPQFGPRAALGFGVAGGVLFALGMAMRIVERMMNDHPYVFWGSLLGVAIALAAAAVLVYSNHAHHVTSTTPTK